MNRKHGGSHLFLGILLIVLGGYFLARNMGWIEWLNFDVVWPGALIILGILLLGRNWLKSNKP